MAPQAFPSRTSKSGATREIRETDRSFARCRTAAASDDRDADTECARSLGRNQGPACGNLLKSSSSPFLILTQLSSNLASLPPGCSLGEETRQHVAHVQETWVGRTACPSQRR